MRGAVGRGVRRLAWAAALAALAPGASSAQTPSIPLEPGLVSSSVSHYNNQDYEVLRVVESVDADSVTLTVHFMGPANGQESEEEEFTITRVMRREDLESANRIIAYYHTKDPELFPGSTATLASKALLESVKTGAETPFIFGMAAGQLGMLGARKYYRGNLTRVEAETVPFSVLLNGERTTLPAIHAKGTLKVGDDVGEGEFWWLDQPENAMTLAWSFKDSHVRVIRIDTPAVPQQSAALATGLASEACRAELHGVYFESGSAALLDESAAAITQVATLLQQQPDWRVTIEGHTDSIGSDADNELLSQQRAEAVRAALAEQGIATDRLAAAGFGETRPIESNDTVEGRARNRRVELARTCP
jgi:outer membrane protein OmpA-like peptidoglycan-associated protein